MIPTLEERMEKKNESLTVVNDLFSADMEGGAIA